jgi:hypothetical protein
MSTGFMDAGRAAAAIGAASGQCENGAGSAFGGAAENSDCSWRQVWQQGCAQAIAHSA